jgi:peptidoglycan/LPS O-acetylase OafA/YrhL
LIPALIAGTVARPQAVVGRVLSLPAMAWVGRLSYSLYLWQQLWVPVAGIPHSLGRVQSGPFNVLAIVLSAVASFYLIERPFIRWASSPARRTTPAFSHALPRELERTVA